MGVLHFYLKLLFFSKEKCDRFPLNIFVTCISNPVALFAKSVSDKKEPSFFMTNFMSRLQVHDFDDRGRHSTCANGSTVQSYANRGRYSVPYLMYRNGIWTMK